MAEPYLLDVGRLTCAKEKLYQDWAAGEFPAALLADLADRAICVRSSRDRSSFGYRIDLAVSKSKVDESVLFGAACRHSFCLGVLRAGNRPGGCLHSLNSPWVDQRLGRGLG